MNNKSQIRVTMACLISICILGCDKTGTEVTIVPEATSPQIGVKSSESLNCGEVATYKNSSGQREQVKISMTNDCEFTAHLWITYANGRFIHREIPGYSKDELTDWIPDDAEIEFECSLVTSPNGSCSFSRTVLQRQ